MPAERRRVRAFSLINRRLIWSSPPVQALADKFGHETADLQVSLQVSPTW